MQLDRKIEASFDTLNQRIQERLRRLRTTKFELPDSVEDLNKDNRNPWLTLFTFRSIYGLFSILII